MAALESGSVLKHIHCVQSLEENLEDIDSLSLKLLAHKIHPKGYRQDGRSLSLSYVVRCMEWFVD